MFVTETQQFYDTGTNEPDKPRLMVKTAAGNDWQTITWGHILDHATQISWYFAEMGIGLNTKIAIFAKNQVAWAYFDVAIHAVRSIFVPIYTSNTPEQVKYIINHSDSEIIITELERLPTLFKIWRALPLVKKVIVIDLQNEDDLDKTLEQFRIVTGLTLTRAEINPQLVALQSIYQRGAELSHDSPQGLKPFIDKLQPTDISTILYTSGTTGEPKGVVLTRQNLHNNAGDWINVLNNLMPDQRIDLLWLPLSHIFGWGELGLGNTLGFTTYMTTSAAVLNDLPKVQPTIFMSVPAYWEKLYLEAKAAATQKAAQLSHLQQLTGGRLKFCLSGGAGLKREIKQFFYDAGLLIIEGYGLTECSPTLTMNRKDDFDFDTVGKPFPSVQLQLADDGEILAKGPNIFREYYKNPQATVESFDADGWFKTGDIGELTDTGFLTIKGRKKEIIVTSGGKNISPLRIESRFKENPYIEHIILYGNEQRYLTALVTLNEDNITRYALTHQIPYRDYSTLVHTPAIYALVQASIEEVNKDLASFETIKKFLIYEGHLTPETGFLTPSLKLKRERVYKVFKSRLEALYQ